MWAVAPGKAGAVAQKVEKNADAVAQKGEKTKADAVAQKGEKADAVAQKGEKKADAVAQKADAVQKGEKTADAVQKGETKADAVQKGEKKAIAERIRKQQALAAKLRAGTHRTPAALIASESMWCPANSVSTSHAQTCTIEREPGEPRARLSSDRGEHIAANRRLCGPSLGLKPAEQPAPRPEGGGAADTAATPAPPRGGGEPRTAACRRRVRW